MDGENLADIYNRTQEAADSLYAQATGTHELTKRLEELTKDTPTGTPPRGLKWKLRRPWSRRRNCVRYLRSWARGWVNKGKRKGRGCYTPTPLPRNFL